MFEEITQEIEYLRLKVDRGLSLGGAHVGWRRMYSAKLKTTLASPCTAAVITPGHTFILIQPQYNRRISQGRGEVFPKARSLNLSDVGAS